MSGFADFDLDGVAELAVGPIACSYGGRSNKNGGEAHFIRKQLATKLGSVDGRR